MKAGYSRLTCENCSYHWAPLDYHVSGLMLFTVCVMSVVGSWRVVSDRAQQHSRRRPWVHLLLWVQYYECLRSVKTVMSLCYKFTAESACERIPKIDPPLMCYKFTAESACERIPKIDPPLIHKDHNSTYDVTWTVSEDFCRCSVRMRCKADVAGHRTASVSCSSRCSNIPWMCCMLVLVLPLIYEDLCVWCYIPGHTRMS